MAEMVLAEFDSAERLAAAVRSLRERGYEHLEAHTPYSTEEVRRALGTTRSRLPRVIFLAGVFGAGGAYFLQWLTVAYLYPLDVGGRPPHFPLAFVPITFEMGVLLAAFTAFFGTLFAGRLLKLWDPVFEVEGFESASIDRFWLRVDRADEELDRSALHSALSELGALRVAVVGGTP
ncbi:MAG TPA: DUF3341 domain-containing protein [Polyangiaceae bacterium]